MGMITSIYNQVSLLVNNHLEFDIPFRIDLKIEEWTLTIDWFYKESDPDRNSNAYNIANDLIDGTGYSGNSRQALVNIIVDEVLRRTSHLYGTFCDI